MLLLANMASPLVVELSELILNCWKDEVMGHTSLWKALLQRIYQPSRLQLRDLYLWQA